MGQTFCSPTGNETLTTDGRHYQPGEAVHITGKGYAPSCGVSVYVIRPGDSLHSAALSTDHGDNLSFSYTLDSLAGYHIVGVYMGQEEDPWTSVNFTNGAYSETDMPDYAPGNPVTISGSGWLPGESITIVIDETDGPDVGMTYTAVADSAGNFTNGDFATNLQDVGVHFSVTATGQSSGYSAQARFKDAFTATTRATGNWNADATWSITRPGAISTTTGSKIVTGNGAGGQNFTVDLAVGNVPPPPVMLRSLVQYPQSIAPRK